MHKHKLLLFFLLINFINFAQKKQIRAYNLEDGLPQSQVYDIVQDDFGYLWLGTKGGGIARFDGEQFKVFNEKKGLISNYIYALTLVNKKLLIGSKYGLSVKDKNVFKNYKSPQINQFLTINNSVFIGTNKGCYVFKNDKLSKIDIVHSINTSEINDIKFSNNWFYFATNAGLYKVSLDFSKKIKLSDFDFKSIAIYKEKIFCASFINGILTFTKNNKSQIINNTKRINNISIINDKLWIATDDNGVTIINTTNYKTVQHYSIKNGLSTSHIRKTIKDKQDNIWLTSASGFFKLYENNFTHFNQNNGLLGKPVYAIHQYNDSIFVSNAKNGLFKKDSLGFHKIKQDNNFLNVKAKTLANDNNGNLFVGTNEKGILVLHNSKKDSIISYLNKDNSIAVDTIKIKYRFTDTINSEKGLPYKWIKKIQVKNNKIWVASYSSGISSFNYSTQDKAIYNLKNYKLNAKDIYVNDIVTDKNNTLWYATKSGSIGYIDKKRHIHLPNILKQNTSIRTLLFHKELLFLATSDKGIWWSNLSKPIKFTRLVGKKELYSNNIYQLIFDAKNQLWAGSENGVDKISLDENNNIKDIKHFGRNDGFLGIETCLNSVIKDKNDNLWFGTINGLTKYQPTTSKQKQEKPNLFFEDIMVMNTSLDSINFTDFSKNKKSIDLKPNQKLLSFYYKSIDLNNPKEFKYRWKIDNLDWSEWKKDTKINISSDYGNHTFYAQSRDLNWLESDVISFQFKRAKPLLKELWFRTLIGAIIGLLLLSLILNYFRKQKLKNQQEKAHLQLENDLLTLEQKALRLQMNPHFIFNVLNGIKAMSLNDTKKMHTTINKFATLLRATLTNSRKNNITLAEEITTLKNYIEVEQLMTEKQFDYTLNVETELDTEEILIPPMLIQPFVENAIRHGILAVKRKGELILYFKTKNNFLHCTIIDNGIGINQSKANKPKSNHQSMALEVTKERIQHLAKNNTLIIEEIINENGKLAGTKVVFKIPLVTDY